MTKQDAPTTTDGRDEFEAWHNGKFGHAYTVWDENRCRFVWDLTQELWLAWQAARASSAAAQQSDPIRGLLQAHEDLIEQGENYAYFELAYTRRTGWMAWLTDRPASGEPGTAEYAKSRKVIARGQGDSAEEACQDALDVMAAPPAKPADTGEASNG